MAEKNNRVAIVGVGYGTCGRNTGVTRRQLTGQAARAALDDAGMTPKDIDGICMHPYLGPEPVNVDAMSAAWMLGINPVNWFDTAEMSGPAFSTSAMQAVAAIRAGFCHTVIAFRIVRQLESASTRPTVSQVEGDAQFSAPFGDAHFGAFYKRRHMAEFGTKEEHFAALAVTQRYHASLNDDALLRTPITVDDYLNSRWISKPLRLLDCDYPCDAGAAVIFTTEDRARQWKKEPVFVDACAISSASPEANMVEDYNRGAPFHCAKELWSRTDLKPNDVDSAHFYDGYSPFPLQWLEALGFCKLGESGPFVAEGNIRLGGKLPMNSDGGMCNVGRRHGANFCIEATRQLRGECGPRQVKDAEVALWTNGGAFIAGAMLLTKG